VRFVFHPAAEAEHLEAIAYYESGRPGLGAHMNFVSWRTQKPTRFPISHASGIVRKLVA
jgi:hypothetical protein